MQNTYIDDIAGKAMANVDKHKALINDINKPSCGIVAANKTLKP